MTRSTGEIVKEYYLAHCRGDSERLRELLAPDVRFHYPQSAYVLRPPVDGENWDKPKSDVPDPYTEGRESMIRSIETAYERFFKHCEAPEFVHFVAEGDVAVSLTRNRAIMQDGTAYHQLYSFHARVENGLVAEVWEVHDTMYAFNVFLSQPAMQTA
jgi:ketosteroid isomerase-like protein